MHVPDECYSINALCALTGPKPGFLKGGAQPKGEGSGGSEVLAFYKQYNQRKQIDQNARF